ncbi:MAG: Binding-protein-dependent transport system inner membrane component [Candidatus Roizmanbacteria bacterium GW2011_GWA2_32_13]|uniref:Binding-protein-dependent transport system inner membrane component n=1 Tax=Candidatus Roizmanbacteria bacterium GW2011_GWA2_32_13 TaxID=1618475 RepID=A0A0F9YZK9_9BACT|nr:MAG: Binding-protein-dependent transport system inner membrane component [Candidatus Roizmanbacteria bacterium GW2011_GWA2_32_13]
MKQYILPVIAGLIILLIWEFIVKTFHIEQWILPAPTQILNSFLQSITLIFYHLVPTLIEAAIGLVVAVFLSVLIAILMERFKTMQKIIYPFLIISQTVPFIILAPLLTLWFGFGLLPKIIIIALVCFFPITINLFDGFQGVDSNVIRLLTSMGANQKQIFRWVKWPASLPAFFSGLRIAAAYSILGAVVSEWMGADRGLGILLVRSTKSYLTDRVFATIGVITILSFFVVFAVEIVARISIPWHFNKLKVKN